MTLLRLLAWTTIGTIAVAQSATTTRQLLDAVIARVETNYAGFVIEVASNPDRLATYRAFCATLFERAASSEPDEALALLHEYVDWFDDGHLFVKEHPRFDPAQLAALRQATPTRSIDGLAGRLRQPGRDLAPIEGLWFTPDHEIAVERVDATGVRYVATILETRSEHWRAGQEIAEFELGEDQQFHATLRLDDHSPRRLQGYLHEPWLRMPPHTWGRRYPLATSDRERLDAQDPRAPRFRSLGDDACVMHLPSLSPRYGKRLGKLVHEHRAAIAAHDLLIVDLRGNSGGSSTAARPLAPFYHGEEREPRARADAIRHVLSCPDTLAYYRQMKSGFFTPAWLRSLRHRLEKNPGKLIPFWDPPRTPKDFVPRRVSKTPAHVALLIDRVVGSAAEAFLLEARRHPRVTSFGEPTAGMIDYQNVLMVAVEAAGHRVLLGYPLIAASHQLPKHGFNRDGIPPDVAIGDEIADPIQWIRDRYR
ncbi:MAG: S41 family peptidase [bacterium]|nr:S41 family peptidase [bacterium]